MDTPQIAFYDAKEYDRNSFEQANGDFGFKIRYFKEHLTPETTALATGCNVVCAFVNDTLNEKVLVELKQKGVELIALRCAGYNNVDLRCAFDNRMQVVRVPSYSPNAVAEHAVALIMSLNRKTHRAYCRTRDLNFSINGFTGFDMAGKTAGVIGTGKIGQILAGILKGFQMNVLAFDPFENEQAAKQYGFKYTDLDTIYENADIISLHCPLTAKTHHLIDAKSIEKMKPGVMLINTGRGQLIDTLALIAGIKDKKIGSAGLDVYEEESQYFFEDFSNSIIDDDVLARLLTFNNVLVTSHQAFLTKEALQNISQTTLENIKNFFAHSQPINGICYKCSMSKGKCDKNTTGECFGQKASPPQKGNVK